ncbi:hypothetical protein [Pseudoramibacter faecis]|uniref:hypothetical protein n=1 Tax=Pseudoramibacter faecis TaxID=3108534 RepID=UPI002E766B36|nr:hypothetical protein [Pseudoramibacter sp. HA2172]
MLAGFLAIAVYMFPNNEVLFNCLTSGFIPFVAFTVAVAGTAYALKIRKHNLNGADIFKSLNAYNDISVPIVSGIFAIAGVVIHLCYLDYFTSRSTLEPSMSLLFSLLSALYSVTVNSEMKNS